MLFFDLASPAYLPRGRGDLFHDGLLFLFL